MSESKFVQRACCRAGIARGVGYVAPLEATTSYKFASCNGPVIAEIDDFPVVRDTCVHESAHAVFAHGFGQRIKTVSAAPPARVVTAGEPATGYVERIALLWAAAAAQASTHNFRITLGLLDEEDHLNRVKAFQHGGCDECQMAANAWAANGFEAGIDAARAVFREGQLLALKLLDRCDVRAAIRTLSDKLADGEIVDGETCHGLIENHLAFGSLRQKTGGKQVPTRDV